MYEYSKRHERSAYTNSRSVLPFWPKFSASARTLLGDEDSQKRREASLANLRDEVEHFPFCECRIVGEVLGLSARWPLPVLLVIFEDLREPRVKFFRVQQSCAGRRSRAWIGGSAWPLNLR